MYAALSGVAHSIGRSDEVTAPVITRPAKAVNSGSYLGSVSRTGAQQSASMYWSRSAGYEGSSGTYAAPAFITPKIDTTSSAERSMHTPTRESVPTPSDWR